MAKSATSLSAKPSTISALTISALTEDSGSTASVSLEEKSEDEEENSEYDPLAHPQPKNTNSFFISSDTPTIALDCHLAVTGWSPSMQFAMPVNGKPTFLDLPFISPFAQSESSNAVQRALNDTDGLEMDDIVLNLVAQNGPVILNMTPHLEGEGDSRRLVLTYQRNKSASNDSNDLKEHEEPHAPLVARLNVLSAYMRERDNVSCCSIAFDGCSVTSSITLPSFGTAHSKSSKR